MNNIISLSPETAVLFFITLFLLLSFKRKIRYLMYIETLISLIIILYIAWFFALLVPAFQDNWFFPILDFIIRFLMQLLEYGIKFLSGYGV